MGSGGGAESRASKAGTTCGEEVGQGRWALTHPWASGEATANWLDRPKEHLRRVMIGEVI